MNLRRYMTTYVITLHLVFFGSLLAVFHGNPTITILAEVFLLSSMIFGIILISRSMQPLDYAQKFHELLQNKNYSARLEATPYSELSETVKLFNSMLDSLYQERLKLGEQRGLLDQLLAATPSGVIVFDFDGRVSLVNESALSLLGIKNPEGKFLSDLTSDENGFIDTLESADCKRSLDLLMKLDRLPLGDSKLLTDSDYRRFRCQRSFFFDRSFARHFLLIEELTAELESSEKATYENLVRVLAHEVNNTVAATGSVLDSLLFYKPQLEINDSIDFSVAIEAVKHRNTSLGEFIERFTQVVKMPEIDLQPTNVREMMENILRLYFDRCRNFRISISWTCCDLIPAQRLDRNLMEQALLNIVQNAMEAVDATITQTENANGYIHIELANEEKRTRLSVIDSGNRLGEVPSGHIFTPFFTTKKGGQGIGLLFVREVFNRHGIPYRLAANNRGETSFDIWFPKTL